MSDWEPTMNLKAKKQRFNYKLMQEWVRPGRGQSEWRPIRVDHERDSWITEEKIGNDVVWWRFWK